MRAEVYMLLQFIYFLVIGWWLGLLASMLGFVLCVSIIGLPFGLILLNRLPSLIYLREIGESCPAGYDHRHMQEELPMLMRVLWFVLVGWELGFIVIGLGYLLTLTIIGLPLGVYLLNRVPFALTLSRHYG